MCRFVESKERNISGSNSMLHLAKRNILVACGCLALFGISSVAQEAPSDYQEVLKALDRKGDFKAGVLKVHVRGMGKAADLARRVKPGLDLIGQVRRD
jgi:hypothetical protein